MVGPVVFGRVPLRAAGDIGALAASPDGSLLAVGTGFGDEASVWALPSLELVGRIEQPASSFAFEPHGRALFVAYAFTHRWAFRSGGVEPFAHGEEIGAPIALSPDGASLVGARPPGDRKEIVLVDTTSERVRWAVATRSAILQGIGFSVDGQRVVVAEEQGVRILDARDGRTLGYREPARGRRPALMALAPDGTIVLGRGDGNQVYVFDRGDEAHRVIDLPFELENCAVSEDGRRLAVVGGQRRTAIVELATGALRELTVDRSVSGDRAAALAGRLLAVSHHRSVVLFDLDLWAQVPGPPAHRDQVTGIAVSPLGAWVATAGGFDRSVRLWRTRDGAHLRALLGHGNRILAVAVSPDARHLATGCADDMLRIFDLTREVSIPSVEVDDDDLCGGEISAVAWLSDGKRLVTASEDGTVALRDGRTGERIRTVLKVGTKDYTGTPPALALSGDQRWIAASGSKREVVVAELESGAVVFARPEGFGQVLALAPSAPWLAVREESAVAVWALPDGALVRRYENTLSSVGCFDRQGLLALTPYGAPACVVDPSRGLGRIVPEGQVGQATAVAFAPDGRLALGFEDGSAMLVVVPARALTPAEAAARRRADRADAARALLRTLAERPSLAGYRDAPGGLHLEEGGLAVLLDRGNKRVRIALSVPDEETTVLRLVLHGVHGAEAVARTPREAEADAFAPRMARWIRRRLGLSTQRDDRPTEAWLAALGSGPHVRSARLERSAAGAEVTFELAELPAREELLAWIDACLAGAA